MLLAGEYDDKPEGGDRAKRSFVLLAVFTSLITLDVILTLVAFH